MMLQRVIGMLFLLHLHQIHGRGSCTTYVCFNWKVTFHELQLICKVNTLHFNVRILDPYGTEQGYCITPTPSSKCEPHYKNGTLSQNTKTNETIFILHGEIDYRINGNWTCLHGRQRDTAQVEVTVLRMKEMYNTTTFTKNINNNQSCKPTDQDYSCMMSIILTTTLSVLVSIVVSLLYLSVFKTTFKRIDDFFESRLECVGICTNSQLLDRILVCKKIAFALSTILLLILAITIGLFNDKSCIAKWVLIAYGLVFESVISVLFLSNVDPRVNNKPDTENGTSVDREATTPLTDTV